MSFIRRRALVALPAVALVSSLAVLPAAAIGAKRAPVGQRVTEISRHLNKIAVDLHNLQGTVNGGIPIITQLVSGLQQAASGLQQAASGIAQLQAGLTQVAGNLTTVATAVQSPTTGLAALNSARSLVGFVSGNAALSGSEFTVSHPGPAGTYILSFKDGLGNAVDVSKRAIVVTPLPGADTDVTFKAGNCSFMGITCLGGTDTKPTDVLVNTLNSAVPADEGFQVAAISG